LRVSFDPVVFRSVFEGVSLSFSSLLPSCCLLLIPVFFFAALPRLASPSTSITRLQPSIPIDALLLRVSPEFTTDSPRSVFLWVGDALVPERARLSTRTVPPSSRCRRCATPDHFGALPMMFEARSFAALKLFLFHTSAAPDEFLPPPIGCAFRFPLSETVPQIFVSQRHTSSEPPTAKADASHSPLFPVDRPFVLRTFSPPRFKCILRSRCLAVPFSRPS